MKDLIDREKTIKAIKKNFSPFIDSAGLYQAIKVIKNMPTVTIERKKGKWIEVKHTFLYKCSECDWMNDVGCSYDFCPSCGADMRDLNNERFN